MSSLALRRASGVAVELSGFVPGRPLLDVLTGVAVTGVFSDHVLRGCGSLLAPRDLSAREPAGIVRAGTAGPVPAGVCST